MRGIGQQPGHLDLTEMSGNFLLWLRHRHQRGGIFTECEELRWAPLSETTWRFGKGTKNPEGDWCKGSHYLAPSEFTLEEVERDFFECFPELFLDEGI